MKILLCSVISLFSLPSLFLFLLFVVTTARGSRFLRHASSLHAARSATTQRRVQRKVDVLLGLNANQERRHVDDLLTNSDVSLLDQDTGVVHRLGQTELKYQSLQSSLQELLRGQRQHVIQRFLIRF